MYDDWAMVPVVTRHEPLTLQWLWAQHNEHRIPLPKLIYLALYYFGASSFRAGTYFNVAILSGMALAMIMTAKRLRGSISYSDGFFPLILLHWGHYENTLSSFQVALTVPAALLTLCLVLILTRRLEGTSSSHAFFVGIVICLLTMCGAPGLAFVPPLAAWLIWNAMSRCYGQMVTAKRAILESALPLIALFLAALYFVGYQKPHYVPPSPSVRTTLVTALKSFAMGFGMAGCWKWPRFGYVVIALLITTSATLFYLLIRRLEERTRAIGLLLFLAGTIAVGLGVGWGRAGYGSYSGFAPRYAILSLPLLCWSYFVWQIRGHRTGRFVQILLFTLACLTLPLNMKEGRAAGKRWRQRSVSFATDVKKETATPVLAERYCPHGARFLYPFGEHELGEMIRMLARTKTGPFRNLEHG
jgi:hypothetical protein